MEDKTNMFNRIKKLIEAKTISLFEDLYDIVTDDFTEKEDFKEKNRRFEESLNELGLFKLGLVAERAYDYCESNRGKAYAYGEDGIKLVDIDKAEVDVVPIEELFIKLYQYILYTTYRKKFEEKLIEKLMPNGCSVGVIVSDILDNYLNDNVGVGDQIPAMTFNDMDEVLNILGATYTASFNLQTRVLTADDCVKKLLSGFSRQEFNKFVFYVEAVCDLINQIQHNPEIFKHELGFDIKKSNFDRDYIDNAFGVRTIVEQMQAELYSKEYGVVLDNCEKQEDNFVSPRTRDNKEGKE